MSYWGRTDEILAELGGHNPRCPTCSTEMFAIDDHGRFRCPNGDDPDSQMEKIMREIRLKPKKKPSSE